MTPNQSKSIPLLSQYKGETFMFQLRESNTHLRIIVGARLSLTRRNLRTWNKQGTDITPIVAQFLGVEYHEGKGIFATTNKDFRVLMELINVIVTKLNQETPNLVTRGFITDAKGGCINEYGQRF